MKQAGWMLVVGAGVVAAGCGQKGPLYLPDQNASVATKPVNTTTAPQPAPAPSNAVPSAAPGGGTPPPAAPAKPPRDKNGDDSQSAPPKS